MQILLCCSLYVQDYQLKVNRVQMRLPIVNRIRLRTSSNIAADVMSTPRVVFKIFACCIKMVEIPIAVDARAAPPARLAESSNPIPLRVPYPSTVGKTVPFKLT